MRLIPAHLRGRVFGLLRTSMQAAPPLGGLAASALLTGPGLRPAVLATALLIGVPGATGLLLRSLNPRAGTDPASISVRVDQGPAAASGTPPCQAIDQSEDLDGGGAHRRQGTQTKPP
jgi:hypothetical protein